MHIPSVSAKGNERQDFLSEIEMMKKVAEGQSPHVVCLLGCVTIQEPLCLITEFVKYGDLLSYLRTNRRIVSFINILLLTQVIDWYSSSSLAATQRKKLMLMLTWEMCRPQI